MPQPFQFDVIKFDQWLSREKDLAFNTRSAYCQRVKDFLAQVDNQVTGESIAGYLSGLMNERSLGPKTYNCYRDAIVNLVAYLGIEVRIPCQRGLTRRLPDVINTVTFRDEILAALMLVSDNLERDTALFYLMMYCGLRPSTIVALKRESFDLENLRGIYYNKKSDSEHMFFYDQKIRDLILEYFMSEPEGRNAFNVSRSTLNRICLAVKAKVPRFRVRPYLFRHSFATMLLERDFNLKEIQEALGNNSLASVLPYLRVNVSSFQSKYLEKIKVE